MGFHGLDSSPESESARFSNLPGGPSPECSSNSCPPSVHTALSPKVTCGHLRNGSSTCCPQARTPAHAGHPHLTGLGPDALLTFSDILGMGHKSACGADLFHMCIIHMAWRPFYSSLKKKKNSWHDIFRLWHHTGAQKVQTSDNFRFRC